MRPFLLVIAASLLASPLVAYASTSEQVKPSNSAGMAQSIDSYLENVADNINAILPETSEKARYNLNKALKELGKAREKFAEGDVKYGLKRLKYVVKALVKAEEEGVYTSDRVEELLNLAYATAEAGISLSPSSNYAEKAQKYLQKGEKYRGKGKPDKAIEYFAKAYGYSVKAYEYSSKAGDDVCDDQDNEDCR